jgi:hypothetical protein
VALAEGADKLVDLGLHLGLTAAWAMTGAAGKSGAATVEELVTPGHDRDLRDPLAVGGFFDRDLTAQHGQHDADLVVDGLDR